MTLATGVWGTLGGGIWRLWVWLCLRVTGCVSGARADVRFIRRRRSFHPSQVRKHPTRSTPALETTSIARRSGRNVGARFTLNRAAMEGSERGTEDSSVGMAHPPATAAADAFSDSLLSLCTPIIARTDDGIQQAINSQAVLSQQIDRVSAELQSFLTASQIPSFSPYAQRLAEVRRRVTAANGTLAQVQARLGRIERLADQLQADAVEPLPSAVEVGSPRQQHDSRAES